MKTARPIKAYSTVEQRLEQFKRENGLKTDSETIFFILTEIAKYAGG